MKCSPPPWCIVHVILYKPGHLELRTAAVWSYVCLSCSTQMPLPYLTSWTSSWCMAGLWIPRY